MALGIPSLVGSFSSKLESNPAVSVTVATDDLLLVAITHDNATFIDGDVTWNGIAMQLDSSAIGTAVATYIYSLKIASGATANVAFVTDAGCCMVIEAYKVTGAAATPFDQQASGTGTSSSPSSGATATTTQADELVFAAIGTNGPSGDAAGTWSGGLGALTRLGTTGSGATTNWTLAAAYNIVAATGAQTGAKTGITSREWGACVATYKALAVTTVATGRADETDDALALGAAKAVSAGRADETDEAAALGSVKIKALGRADETESALALTPLRAYPVGVAEESDDAPGPDDGGPFYAYERLLTEANGVDGISVPEIDTVRASTLASRGIRSLGLPYFAAWMKTPGDFTGIGGGEQSVQVIMALHAAPTKRASNDEPNFFWSCHEIGGVERFSMGVTPDLRLCCQSGVGPVLYSAPGLVVADGVARVYQMLVPGGAGRQISIDNLVVAWDNFGADADPTPLYMVVGASGLPLRFMAFNGVAGTSRLDCTIFGVTVTPENDPVEWPFGTPAGLVIAGFESLGDGVPLEDDYPGADFNLTMDWYDPSPYYPRLFDAPSQSVQSAFKRALNTQYRERTIIRPDYRLVGS